MLADIRDAREHGAKCIFLVDDNITLNVHRFEALCHAIIEARLNDTEYFIQGMTSAIANHGETLAPLMRQAGFRYVFLGIENILEDDLQFLRASAKNRERGERGENDHDQECGDGAVDDAGAGPVADVGTADERGDVAGSADGERVGGGLMPGGRFVAADLVDWPYIQHPTPYPGTPMTKDFVERNLLVNERVEEYDGTTAVVRSEHLESEEIEFLRWRKERWMKLAYFPNALRHSPGFVLRNGPKMLAHTFRGCNLRTLLGLEDERAAFRRYRELRAAERVYI